MGRGGGKAGAERELGWGLCSCVRARLAGRGEGGGGGGVVPCRPSWHWQWMVRSGTVGAKPWFCKGGGRGRGGAARGEGRGGGGVGGYEALQHCTACCATSHTCTRPPSSRPCLG